MSLTGITLPASVREICDKAFYWCRSLVNRELGGTGEYIGSQAFDLCTSLVRVDIPSSVRYIGINAFFGCSALSSVSFGDGELYLDEASFSSCTSLVGIDLPIGLSHIGDYAFSECDALRAITVPSTVSHIGVCAISCNAGSVTFAECSGWYYADDEDDTDGVQIPPELLRADAAATLRQYSANYLKRKTNDE